MVLEEKNEAKLRYMTSSMIASKTSSKSTCATWLRYCREREGSQSKLVVEPLVAYWLSWSVLLSGLEDGLNAYVSLRPFCLPRKRSWLWLIVLGVSLHMPLEVH